MTPRLAAVLGFALLGLALPAGPSASAEAPTIYKWVDENGVAHYTTDRDRIPSEIRTRVERATPPVAAPPHAEDEMRDAVRVKPRQPIAAPAPAPAPATQREEATSAPPPAPASHAVAPNAPAPSKPVAHVEEIPPPLAEDAPEAIDPVSSPPPAPMAPLPPQQSAELAKLDVKITELEGEIEKREEKLAALISSSEDQRSTPLVDDPAFREISQRLPKLQAQLQTLRERRNKIQPPATP